MKFDHIVKHGDKFYMAGEDVPVKQPTHAESKPAATEVVEKKRVTRKG